MEDCRAEVGLRELLVEAAGLEGVFEPLAAAQG
jgi:hypothetical protein